MLNLFVLGLLVVYGGGAWKFWQGYHRTNFSEGKMRLTLMWPILLATNKSYRKNFQKALKGR